MVKPECPLQVQMRVCRWWRGRCKPGRCDTEDLETVLSMQYVPPLHHAHLRTQRNSRAATVWRQRGRRNCQNEVEVNDELPLEAPTPD